MTSQLTITPVFGRLNEGKAIWAEIVTDAPGRNVV